MCLFEAVLAFRQYDRECVIRNSQFAMGQSMAMRATRHCFVLSALSPLSPFPALPSLRILRLCAPSHAIIDGPPACREKGLLLPILQFAQCHLSVLLLTYSFPTARICPHHVIFNSSVSLAYFHPYAPLIEDYRVKY